MSPKAQKISLFVIIIAIVIFGSLSAYSVYLKIEKEKADNYVENPAKLDFYDGKLWFYDLAGNLLGKYACENTICSIGKATRTDNEYSLESYNAQTDVELPVINNQFVFLRDTNDASDNSVFLYDLKTSQAYKDMMYRSVKTYQLGLENNLYIVENSKKQFGVIQVGTVMSPVISFSYDFLGLLNNVTDNGKIATDTFVGYKNGVWQIIDKGEKTLAEEILEPIVTYTDNYIITADQMGSYHIVNYNGEKEHEADFKKIWFTSEYLNCITHNNEFFVYNLKSSRVVSEVYPITDTDIIKTELATARTLDIYINGSKVSSVTLF